AREPQKPTASSEQAPACKSSATAREAAPSPAPAHASCTDSPATLPVVQWTGGLRSPRGAVRLARSAVQGLPTARASSGSATTRPMLTSPGERARLCLLPAVELADDFLHQVRRSGEPGRDADLLHAFEHRHIQLVRVLHVDRPLVVGRAEVLQLASVGAR